MGGLWVHSDALDEGLSSVLESQNQSSYSISAIDEFDDISISAGKDDFVFDHLKTYRSKSSWSYHRSGNGNVGRPVFVPAHFDDRAGKFVKAHLIECGDYLRAVSCSFSDCETRKEDTRIKHSCGSLACPTCFRSVADNKAGLIVDHHQGLLSTFESEWEKMAYHKRFGDEKHIVFSPSQDGHGTVWLGPLLNKAGKDISSRRRKWSRSDIESDGMATLVRELRKILKESFANGFFPGTIVPHLERKKHFAPVAYHLNVHGQWSVCYDDDCQLEHEVFDDWVSCEDDECQLDHRWFYGPHVHFDGYGFIEPSKTFQARTGWSYKNIQNSGGRSTFATVGYLLKHSAMFHRVDDDGHVHRKRSYSHVSLFSNFYGGFLERSREVRPSVCESCGSPKCDYDLGVDDEVDYSHDLGIHNEVVIHGNYYVRIDGQVYPGFLRKAIEERAVQLSERRKFSDELRRCSRRLSVVGSKDKVFDDDSLFKLKDGKVLLGFNDPNVIFSHLKRVRHRRRYRPHPYVGVS